MFLIAALLASTTVTIRRLHDQDRSGWFGILFLIPLIGQIMWLAMMAVPGTRGPNRFGADPAVDGPQLSLG